MQTQPRHLTIPPGATPERLDRALAELLAGEHSRSSIARWIREGLVRLNGRAAKPRNVVVPGDEVVLDLPASEPSDIEPEDLPITIVWQDEHLAVVDKPAGMVTHPAGPLRTGTLVNALLFHIRDLSGVGGVLRPGIVHRLDRGTTGLLVVAKHDESHRRLASDLQKRTVKRTYCAIAWGEVAAEPFLIDAPIGRHERDRKKMGVVANGKEARTHVRARTVSPWASSLELDLDTGRTHQIRVHLQHVGHPIVGDAVYGGRHGGLRRLPGHLRPEGRTLLEAIDRPALHARRLAFRHPFNGNPLVFEREPPEDYQHLEALLTQLKLPREDGFR